MDDDVAVLMLTEVDYRTGRLHDMAALTAQGARRSASSRSGTSRIPPARCRSTSPAAASDFAVGCGYKYLNGGPGAPAFIYVRPDLQARRRARRFRAGWAMRRRSPSISTIARRRAIDRLRVGTPPVLSMAALEAALDVWDGVDMRDVRARSIAAERGLHAERRGARARTRARLAARSRVGAARRCRSASTQGYAAMQALIARRRDRRFPRARHHALRLHAALSQPRRGASGGAPSRRHHHAAGSGTGRNSMRGTR